MNFEKVELEFTKISDVDIIATSLEEPTQTPIEPSTKHDPYADDKW